MAYTGLPDVVDALLPEVDKKLRVQWNRFSKLLSILPISLAGAGYNCQWIAEFEAAQARSYLDGYAVQDGEFDKDADKVASLPWARYRSPKAITMLAKDASRTTGSTADPLRQIQDHILMQGSAAIVKLIGKDLYTGTGANGSIIGLDAALGISGTYAGIDRTANVDWRATVVTSVGAYTVDKVRNAVRQVSEKTDAENDFYLCNDEMCSWISSQMDERLRYNGDMSNGVHNDGVPLHNLMLLGKPVYADNRVAAGKIYGGSYDSSAELMVLPHERGEDDFLFMTGAGVNRSGNHLIESVGLPIHVVPLAKRNGGDSAFDVFTPNLQFAVKHPNRWFVMSGITAPVP